MQEILTLTLFACLAGFVALDFAAPARSFPKVPWWRLKGTLSFVAYLVVSTLAPVWWNGVLEDKALMDLRSLGTWWGALVGVIVAEVFSYGWHRALHRVPFLWRNFHQLHHSAERLDIFGAFWFHPLDALGFTFVGSFALVFVLGLSTEAAVLASTTIALLAAFTHVNIRTPRWLGFIVHRPETHAIHHQRGLHAYNYCEIPLIDWLFGTYRNPPTWEGQAGFWDGASSRIAAMLRGRDISSEPRRHTVTGAIARTAA